MRNKFGQQEIVGFVLIVVLVVVGLMVFLIISANDSSEVGGSVEVGYMLDAIMGHTTGCAIVYEPAYDDFEDLFKSCYSGDDCKNLGRSACDYLNESLADVVGAMIASEATVSAYEVDFFVKDGAGLLKISDGECLGGVVSAQRSIVSDSDSLIVRMKICSKL